MADDDKLVQIPMQTRNAMDVMDFQFGTAQWNSEDGNTRLRVLILQVPGLQMRFYLEAGNAKRLGAQLSEPLEEPPPLELPPKPSIVVPHVSPRRPRPIKDNPQA